MEIIEIKPIGKKGERCCVVLSSGEKVILHSLTLIKTKLKVGSSIEVGELEEYQFEYEKLVAFDKVIDLLSKSSKTKQQVEKYLFSKGYMPKVISYVLDKVVEYGYINDKNYAQSFVKCASNSKSKKAIAFDLRQKGVDKAIIDVSLELVEDEKELVLKLAKKYMTGKPHDQKNKEKLFRHLVGKGFSFEDVGWASRKIFQDNEEFH